MEGQERGAWGSNLGFVLAAMGSAIGLGNLWGFPYKMGANGGFPFLVIYLIMVIGCGVVVMGLEMAIGRNTRKSPILAMGQLGKKFKVIGLFGVLSAFVIMGFYSVLIGYSLRYLAGFGLEIFGGAGFAGMDGAAFFGAYTGNIGAVIGYTALAFVISGVIVAAGIQSGIERFNKIGIPSLFVILIVIIVYGLTLPGSKDGLTFMFSSQGMQILGVEFDFFNACRAAGGQMLFSLSLGMGALITYGSYLDDKANISKNAWVIPAADTAAAILAGMAIFPVVFAMGQSPAGGPGLLFITMHNTFFSMGGIGLGLGVIFYLLVIFAGVSSAISLMEVVASNFIDQRLAKGKPANRRQVVLGVSAAMFVLSLFVACDKLGGSVMTTGSAFVSRIGSLLDTFDFFASGIMMPLGAMLISLVVGWGKGIPWLKAEMEKNGNKFYCEKFFTIFTRYITPLLMLFVLISLALSYLGI